MKLPSRLLYILLSLITFFPSLTPVFTVYAENVILTATVPANPTPTCDLAPASRSRDAQGG